MHTLVDTLLKADIFFFIASVATVVLTVLVSIVLFYFIKAGKSLSKLSDALAGGFKESEEFVMELKERLEDNMAFRLFFPPSRRRKRIKEKAHDVKE